MAAPTPVSALVHSSTLVTARVCLLNRLSPSFNYWLNVILLLVSGLTIFIAGLGANFEFDLKKIIAHKLPSNTGWFIGSASKKIKYMGSYEYRKPYFICLYYIFIYIFILYFIYFM
jgi:NADH-ubiquinone oxidoreductase chain 5